MLVAYDESKGQFIWRANLEVIDESMDDVMQFPKEFDQSTTNVETLFIAGGKSNYIKYDERFFFQDDSNGNEMLMF